MNENRVLKSKANGIFSRWDINLALVICFLLFAVSIVRLQSATSGAVKMDFLQKPSGTQATNSAELIQKIQSANLFGVYSNDSVTSSTQPTPEEMKLRGIMVNKQKGYSQAIIAAGGIEKSYRIGEALPDGAMVEEIAHDQVVINRKSQRIVLRLRVTP